MKLWIDDIRPAPVGYILAKSVNIAKEKIRMAVQANISIEEINIDHDAGLYAFDGGDYIKLLDWLEESGYSFGTIHIHSMNPVGVENMRRIIKRNNWDEV